MQTVVAQQETGTATAAVPGTRPYYPGGPHSLLIFRWTSKYTVVKLTPHLGRSTGKIQRSCAVRRDRLAEIGRPPDIAVIHPRTRAGCGEDVPAFPLGGLWNFRVNSADDLWLY